MSKLLFLDVETTGLDPNKHGVIQVAMLHGASYINFKANPGKGVEYDKEALKINKVKKKEIKKFEDSDRVLKKVINFLGTYVNKYAKDDKFIAVGYNVKFDVEMMHGWARREGFKFMGSYIDWRVIDVLVLARTAHYLGQMPGEPEDFKLGTICRVYGIKEPTHDALEDIVATKELFHTIIKEWK